MINSGIVDYQVCSSVRMTCTDIETALGACALRRLGHRMNVERTLLVRRHLGLWRCFDTEEVLVGKRHCYGVLETK